MLSVIIPTYKRNDLLALCLNQLTPGKQTLDFSEYEVIVTDDSPNFEAKCFIETNYPWAKWVEGKHNGPAANRNNGASFAKGEWLVFFDDDCIPDSNILEEYIKAIKSNPTTKVFEGRIYVDRPKMRLDEEAPINETGGYLWSCNIMIVKDTFYEIGCFDEDFPFAAHEDIDLNKRLNKENIPVRFISNASVCHPWRKSGGYKTLRNKRKAYYILLEKHPEIITKHPLFKRIKTITIFFKNIVIIESFHLRYKGFKNVLLNFYFKIESLLIAIKKGY